MGGVYLAVYRVSHRARLSDSIPRKLLKAEGGGETLISFAASLMMSTRRPGLALMPMAPSVPNIILNKLLMNKITVTNSMANRDTV